MSDTMIYSALVIGVMALVTVAIRVVPFVLFDRGNTPPKWVETLGKLLPPACMSVLVIYCLRNIDITSGNHGLPDLICVAVAMGLHAWKRNTLLSICVSTILYMVLIQLIFV